MTVSRRPGWPVWLAIAHALLALFLGALNPPFEAHDETGHYAYVRYVASKASLPNAQNHDTRAMLDQSHQPPLYYVVQALLTGWVRPPSGDPPYPNVFAVDGTNRRGIRLLLRAPGEANLLDPELLPLRTARAVSALIGGGLVYVIGQVMLLVFGASRRAAMFGTGLVAFNPQLVFISSMVNNDVLVALLGAVVAWSLVRMAVDDGATRPRGLAILGVALGLSLLSKNSAFALVAFAGLVLIFVAVRRRWPVSRLAGAVLATGLPCLAVAGPYFVFNVIRYGRPIVDRTVNNPLLDNPTGLIGEGIAVALRDQWLPAVFVDAFRTSWGAFGWGNVTYPDAVYGLVFVFCAAGVVAAVVGARRASPTERAALVTLAGLGLAMVALPLYRTIYFQSPGLMPGRYLMPAAAGYAGIVAFGWRELGRRLPPKAGVVPLVALVALVLATPFVVLDPAYQAKVQPQAIAAPVLTFGGKVALLGASAESVVVNDQEGPRQYARVRATWQALAPVSEQLAFGISVVGPGETVLGMANLFPGLGNYPSTNWRTGDVWQDQYFVQIEKPCAPLPALGRINFAVYDAIFKSGNGGFDAVKAGVSLPAADPLGRPVTPLVGEFRVSRTPETPKFWIPGLASIDGVVLRDAVVPVSAKAGGPVTVSLTYEAGRAGLRRASAFVHALDAGGRLVAQDDRTLGGDAYPSDLWQPGECATETFWLNLPSDAPTSLRLVTGLYDPRTQTRLPAGTRDDLVELGPLRAQPGP